MTHQARTLQAIAWPILLLAIYVCFFWKLVLTSQYTWLEGPDFANQVMPWFQMQAREWHQGRFPLWDPFVWGGQPLLAQAQPGAAYPPNWLLFILPLDHGFIRISLLHWYFVLIHYQAGLFCYFLCRDLKLTPAASLLSGTAFGLGGFVGTTDWPQMLNGAVWAPLIVMFFLRSVRGEREVSSAAWSGALLGVSLLSGHHQVPTFIALTMAALWIYKLWKDPRKVKLLLVFGAFAALVSALQVLPAYEYGNLALRWVGAENPVGWKDRVPYYIHDQYSLFPESIFGVVIPGVFRHSNPFVGLVALTLALLGLTAYWRNQSAKMFGMISLGGLLFSLGRNSVFHGMLYSVAPMVEKARNPSMASFIFHFGLCVLVAYGLDGFLCVSAKLLRRTTWILLGFSALTVLIGLTLKALQTPFDERLAMVGLAGLSLAAILTAWRKNRISPMTSFVLLLLTMLLELGNVTTYGYPVRGQDKSLVSDLSQHDDIANFLRAQPDLVRVEIDQNDIAFNFGDWYGIDHFGGYLASLTTNVSRVQGSPAARMLYGVDYYVGKRQIRPDQVEVFQAKGGLNIFRNPSAQPRAWIVHAADAITRDDQVLPHLEASGFDSRRRTFVKGTPPQLEECPGAETIRMLEREPSRVLLVATLSCRGMVIDSDTFFPGWVALVDGRPTPIYEAYGCLRGVVADKGEHRIELRYRPRSVSWGAALTFAGLIGALGLTFRRESVG